MVYLGVFSASENTQELCIAGSYWTAHIFEIFECW